MNTVFACLVVCGSLLPNLVLNLNLVKPRDSTNYWDNESNHVLPDNSQVVVDRPKLAHKWFPFLVAIHRWHIIPSGQWFHSCSGSIISAEVVLTSCQCVGKETTGNKVNYYFENWVRVIAGSPDPRQPSPHSQTIEVKGFKAHPLCTSPDSLMTADLGFVFLMKPFVFNQAIQPLVFYSRDVSEAYAALHRLVEWKTICYTPGWGSTSESLSGSAATFSVHPSLTAVRLVTEDQCKTNFCSLHSDKCRQNFSENNQVCVMPSPNSPSCFSDIGGPLICDGYVFGVASWTVDHCITGSPIVFTDIGAILDILNFYGHEYKSLAKWQGAGSASGQGHSNSIPFSMACYTTFVSFLLNNLS